MFNNNYIFNTKYNLSWNLANYILAEWLRNPGKGTDVRELKSQKISHESMPPGPLYKLLFTKSVRIYRRSAP